MNSTNPNNDLLVDFIDNNLSIDDKLKVEELLQNDATLQMELDYLLLAKSAIVYYGIKTQISLIHKEVMDNKLAEIPILEKNGIVRSLTKWSLRIAASVLIVMLGLAIYQYATISADKLFNENYSAYTLGTTRGENSITAIENAFKNKDFASVINQFSLLTNPTQKEIFLSAQSYLAIKNYSKASIAFNAVMDKNGLEKTTLFNDDAEYFLAISYLKNNEIDLAKSIFKRINNSPAHLYSDKVTNAFLLKLTVLSWKK